MFVNGETGCMLLIEPLGESDYFVDLNGADDILAAISLARALSFDFGCVAEGYSCTNV